VLDEYNFNNTISNVNYESEHSDFFKSDSADRGKSSPSKTNYTESEADDFIFTVQRSKILNLHGKRYYFDVDIDAENVSVEQADLYAGDTFPLKT